MTSGGRKGGKLRRRLARKLDTSLARIENAQLVRRLDEPELTYLFKHTLVQEATYTSLTKHDRKRLHEMIAHTLEDEPGVDLDKVSAQLARHFTEAGDREKTFQYALCAGNVAARVYAHDEALSNYTLALQVASNVATSDDLIQLYTRRGRMFELAGRYQDALANYGEMEGLAHTRGDRGLELEALMLCATLLAVGAGVRDWNKSNHVSQQALSLARETNNPAAEARIFWNLLLANRFADAGLAQAIDYGEQSIALAEEFDLREQLALSLKDLAIAHMRAGQFDAVPDMAEHAIVLLREMNDKPMLAETLGVETLLHFSLGQLDRAAEYGQEAYALNQAIDNPLGQNVIGLWLPMVYHELGQIDRCLAMATQAIEYFEPIGYTDLLWDIRPIFGWILGSLGAVQEGLDYNERAQASFPELYDVTNAVRARLLIQRGELRAARAALGDAPHRSFQDYLRLSTTPPGALLLLLAHAEVALATGDPAGTLAIIEGLTPWLEAHGFRMFALEGVVLHVRALAAQGQMKAAYSLLGDARERAADMHAHWTLLQLLTALVEIEIALGDFDAAQTTRSNARSVAEFIAAHTPDAYRASFLNLSRVHDLFQSENADARSS